MIGLYILITKLLEKEKTIKFGMSMRIEYRWIDYLAIFNDSKYIYYYEFLDNLSRDQILDIEEEIIQLYKHKRNDYFQTEYFYCEDYVEFHKTITTILNKRKINYKVHNIHNFEKKYYDNKPESFEYKIKPNIEEIIINDFKPYYYQQEILDNINEFYRHNNIGKIIHCCGLGKSLLSLFIVQKLNCKLVVIGVPSVYLQKQMKYEIIRLFNNPDNILYIGGENEYNEEYTIQATTNNNDIIRFINRESEHCKFIITTYSSCNLLIDNFYFDFKIGDESHHLVGSEFEKTKYSFHKIKSKKTLFMTATEKIIENNKTSKILFSMDDENIFGKYIDKKSINWAIENKKITDYNIVIIKNTEVEIDNIINSLNINNIQNSINKELFLCAFMALKTIEKYNDLTHILIYTNKTENAELVKKFIDSILDLNVVNISKENYYNNALHSNSKKTLTDIKLSNGKIIEGELSKFKKASWGIISSVYIFGEGFDCPRLNGVIFGENMESDIRIVQSTLRPNRLDKDFPNKKAYVIIPYIDTENFITDNNSFDKCRKIISKIRNVDETVEQKINVVSLNSYDDCPKEKLKEKIKYYNIIENGDELTKIILRLRYSKALGSKCTDEEDEFNYIKQLNKEFNIQDKEEYTNNISIKEKHKLYIENPEEYFRLKGVWTNWYDFMGVDTKKFIQDKKDWINFCKDNNVNSIDEYKKICDLFDELPKNPGDFYKDFSSIHNELKLNRGRR